MHKQTLKIL